VKECSISLDSRQWLIYNSSMKTVIVALNSKYIHSSLAVWYLKASCEDCCGEVRVMEFTINDNPDSVLASIYSENADVAAFSCYIWNVDHVLRLAANLKKVSPYIKIILGGPEISFDACQLMSENACVDYVIAGEGETAFISVLKQLERTNDDMKSEAPQIEGVGGIFYRKDSVIESTGQCSFLEDLDRIPSPYTPDMLESMGNRIVYFESSRGCPFNCSYCLSSTSKGVRYFSLDRVKSDLKKLTNAGIRLVKFVDRTFNSHRQRAKEILKYIIESTGQTSFHFEVAADLFDDEMLDMLTKAPPGKIQFEIGVQTTNRQTLESIDRITRLDRVFYNVERLKKSGNIHLHLDLIAGLPYEDYDTFKVSFNEVYSLKPHQLQLGFLKLLKGSKLRNEACVHGYSFRLYPPYEALFNKYIKFGEMLIIKGIEEIVERYYNSGRFLYSLDYIVGSLFDTPFAFFEALYMYSKREGYLDRPLAARNLYTVLLNFVKSKVPEEFTGVFNDLLKLDFLASDSSNNLPEGIDREIPCRFKEKCFDFLKDESNIERFIPGFRGEPAKQIFKKVHFEFFNYDITNNGTDFKKEDTVVLFDYTDKSRITGTYAFVKIEL
jgi:radical SAM superfamily enzyme YgiQ (UPF0313 family)